MNITFVNECTTNELKLQADWHRKQAEKLEHKFQAEFATAEKHRANTCVEGEATSALEIAAFYYLNKFYIPTTSIEYYLQYRPSTKMLLNKGGIRKDFSTDKPYYNKYFASQWYKNNYERIVTDWFNSGASK